MKKINNLEFQEDAPGKVTMSDDFDDELPPEIIAGFTGEGEV